MPSPALAGDVKAKYLAKAMKLTVKTKAQCEASRKAKVKATIAFKPISGISGKKTKSITLKQG